MSISNSKKPRLNTAVGFFAVVAVCGILGHAFFQRGESKAPPREPGPTVAITQFTPSVKASEPKEPANVATPFEPEEASKSPSGVDLSQESIRRMGLDEYEESLKPERSPTQVTTEDLINLGQAVVILDQEGVIARFDAFEKDSRAIFLDAAGYKAWRQDPATFRALDHYYYIDSVFTIREGDFSSLMKQADEAAKSGQAFELTLPISISHSSVKKAALAALKQHLKAKGVKDADLLTEANIKTIRPTNVLLSIPDGDDPSKRVNTRMTISTADRDKDGTISFRLRFQGRDDYSRFRTALANGTCRIKYDLYGTRVTPTEVSTYLRKVAEEFGKSDAQSDVHDGGLKIGANEYVIYATEKSGGVSGGIGPMPFSLFFDFATPATTTNKSQSGGDQYARRDMNVYKRELNDFVDHIFESIGYHIDMPSGTSEETIARLNSIAKRLWKQARADTNVETIDGKIVAFDESRNAFVIKLNGQIERDFSPSELTALKDQLNRKFQERYERARKNSTSGKVNLFEIIEAEGSAEGENHDSGDASTESAYEALMNGRVLFPVSFSITRVGKYYLDYVKRLNVDETIWEEGVFPATNGLLAVVREREEVKKTLTFEDVVRVDKFLGLRNGSGCLSNTAEFWISVLLSAQNTADGSIVFSNQLDATVSGNDSIYEYALEKTYAVSRDQFDEKVVGPGNAPGATFQFLRFVGFDNGTPVEGRYTATNYNRGWACYDDVPHDCGALPLLDHCQALKNVLGVLEAKAEWHDYDRTKHHRFWRWCRWYPRIMTTYYTYSDACRTREKGVSLTFKPSFRYEVRTQLPTLEVVSNKGGVVFVDENADGNFTKVSETDAPAQE